MDGRKKKREGGRWKATYIQHPLKTQQGKHEAGAL